MKTSTETQRELDIAQQQLTAATRAHEAAKLAFETSNREQKRARRDAMDDAEAAKYEAQTTLDHAQAEHTATLKSEKLSQLRAEQDGANEVPRIFQKELAALAKAFVPVLRQVGKFDQLLQTHADRAAAARTLANELGESVTITPFTTGHALALALEAFSQAEGAGYYRPNLLRWLDACPDDDERAHRVLGLVSGSRQEPVGTTAIEASRAILQAFHRDPHAVLAELASAHDAPFSELRDAADREYVELSQLTQKQQMDRRVGADRGHAA
jgi:hypothetical protein